MSKRTESEVWYKGRSIWLKKDGVVRTYQVLDLTANAVIFIVDGRYKETFTYWDLLEIRKGTNKDYSWIGGKGNEV